MLIKSGFKRQTKELRLSKCKPYGITIKFHQKKSINWRNPWTFRRHNCTMKHENPKHRQHPFSMKGVIRESAYRNTMIPETGNTCVCYTMFNVQRLMKHKWSSLILHYNETLTGSALISQETHQMRCHVKWDSTAPVNKLMWSGPEGRACIDSIRRETWINM